MLGISVDCKETDFVTSCKKPASFQPLIASLTSEQIRLEICDLNAYYGDVYLRGATFVDTGRLIVIYTATDQFRLQLEDTMGICIRLRFWTKYDRQVHIL